AQAELERVTTLKGLRAVYLGTNVNGRELSDPAFAPIFARCEGGAPGAAPPDRGRGRRSRQALLPAEPPRQPVRHGDRGCAPRFRRRPRSPPEAPGMPAPRGRRAPLSLRPAPPQPAREARDARPRAPALRALPPALHVRHDQPLPGGAEVP